MKIRHDEIIPLPENPFAECKLGREPFARALTEIVNSYADGFVLSIDNQWGTGKTTFVKMWEQQLKNEGFKTLFFNAWEHDFDDKPLPAILAELKTLLGEDLTSQTFKDLVAVGSVFIKRLGPIALKIAAKQLGLGDDAGELLQASGESFADALNEDIEEFVKRKKGLKEFKEKLESFIIKYKGDKPLIFFIDELDRCRPDYAVEVLEKIKHFFSVKGIVFVLAIDKKQLGNAIKGFYGSEHIDSNEYLRRFIDLEFIIPEPNTEKFCKHLFFQYGLDKFTNNSQRMLHNQFKDDERHITSVASILFTKDQLPLRVQQKIFAHSSIGLNFYKKDDWLFPQLFLILIYLRTVHSDFYRTLQKKISTPQEIIDAFTILIPKENETAKLRHFIMAEAHLAYLYNRSLPHENRIIIVTGKPHEEPRISLESKVGKVPKQNIFIEYILKIDEMLDGFEQYTLDYFLKKVDLIDEFVS